MWTLAEHHGAQQHREQRLGLQHQGGQAGRHPSGHADEQQPELPRPEEQAHGHHGTRADPPGRGTMKTAGTATRAKRSVANSSGGKSASPSSITTKFTPQITATRTARAVSRKSTRSPRATGTGAVHLLVLWCTRKVRCIMGG